MLLSFYEFETEIEFEIENSINYNLICPIERSRDVLTFGVLIVLDSARTDILVLI